MGGGCGKKTLSVEGSGNQNLRPTVLYGEYELAIDEKSRMLVPADIRRALDVERDGEAFFITVGENGQLWLFPERRYEAFVSQMESVLTPDENRLAFDQLYFSMASKVDWDKQGRILISEKLRARTKLGRDVTMLGVRDHLELWNRTEWADRMTVLEQQRTEIVQRQRIAQQQAQLRPVVVQPPVAVSPVVGQ